MDSNPAYFPRQIDHVFLCPKKNLIHLVGQLLIFKSNQADTDISLI